MYPAPSRTYVRARAILLGVDNRPAGEGWARPSTVLQRNIRLLERSDFDYITLVSGREPRLLRRHFPDCDCVHIGTGSLAGTAVSLALALKSQERGPVLLIKGDIPLDEPLLERFVAPTSVARAAIRTGAFRRDDVKVLVRGDSIQRMSSELPPTSCLGAALGLYLLTPAFSSALLNALCELKTPLADFEEAMDRLVRRGVESMEAFYTEAR